VLAPAGRPRGPRASRSRSSPRARRTPRGSGRRMIPVVHRDHDRVEGADPRHPRIVRGRSDGAATSHIGVTAPLCSVDSPRSRPFRPIENACMTDCSAEAALMCEPARTSPSTPVGTSTESVPRRGADRTMSRTAVGRAPRRAVMCRATEPTARRSMSGRGAPRETAKRHRPYRFRYQTIPARLR
jgi:hypothetical protein